MQGKWGREEIRSSTDTDEPASQPASQPSLVLDYTLEGSRDECWELMHVSIIIPF